MFPRFAQIDFLLPFEVRRHAVRFLATLKSPASQRIILGVSVILVGGGVVLALAQQPDLLRNLSWFPVLLVLLVGVPATILLNAYEFLLSGLLIGSRVPYGRSLEITIIGTAANMLPLPGGMLVRVAALKFEGAATGASVQATLIVASVWVGVAFLIAGLAALAVAPLWLSAFFLVFGVATSVLALSWAQRLSGDLSVPFTITLVKTGLVLTDIGRTCLCFWAIGVAADYLQSSTFAVASVVGNATSVVPAGLGVREGLSALLAPLVGLSAAAGFLAAALNRLLGLFVLLPLGVLLAARQSPFPVVEDPRK